VAEKRRKKKFEKDFKINELIRKLKRYFQAPISIEVSVANDDTFYHYGNWTQRRFTITPLPIKNKKARADMETISGKHNNFEEFKRLLESKGYNLGTYSAVNMTFYKGKDEDRAKCKYHFRHNGIFLKENFRTFTQSTVHGKVAKVEFEEWKRECDYKW
jgi:hypothetical protein